MSHAGARWRSAMLLGSGREACGRCLLARSDPAVATLDRDPRRCHAPLMRDKLDWHAASATEAGEPAEHGFVHIACFIHWLAGRGWLGGPFTPADVNRIAGGSIALDDLIQLTDEQLTPGMGTGEGRRFGSARYDIYLERWGQAFADLPTYAVPWDTDVRAKARTILDELYASWVEDGRPRGAEERSDGFQVHQRPEAEHLLAAEVAGLELDILSFIVSQGLADQLQAAGIDPARSALVLGLHASEGRSSKGIRIDLLVAPGASVAQLDQFATADASRRLARAATTDFGSVEVTAGRRGDWHGARWSRDGVTAAVLVRSSKRLGAVVQGVDATLRTPIELPPMRPTPGPGAHPFEFERGKPHMDTDLEALLPGEVMAEQTVRMSDRLDGWYQQYRAPIAAAGFDPSTARIAWAHGPELNMTLVKVSDAPAAALGPIAERFIGDAPRSAKRTVRRIGDREITWLKGRGWATAVWVRDGLVCSAAGPCSEELLLEAIERMP